MEVKTINGIVSDTTENSIKIDGKYFKAFDLEFIKNINIGDNVKVNFVDVEKNAKIYHNIKDKVEKLTLEKEAINVLLPKLKSDTQINTLVMQSVTLALGKELTLEQATTEIIKCYQRITEI